MPRITGWPDDQFIAVMNAYKAEAPGQSHHANNCRPACDGRDRSARCLFRRDVVAIRREMMSVDMGACPAKPDRCTCDEGVSSEVE